MSRRVHLVTAILCIAAVALALLAQHRFEMQPCPWCILQRVVFIAVAAVSLVSAWAHRPVRLAGHGVVSLLSLGGLAAAVYQNRVAAKTASCDLSQAERWLSALDLARWWPDVFEIRAGCADAAVSILGVPFEIWSALLFTALAALALWALVRTGSSVPSAR